LKKTIAILLVITLLISTTIVVSADWPSSYGTQPSLSYIDYPYRFMFRSTKNDIIYIASKQKWQAVKIPNAQLYDMQDILPSGQTASFRVYKVVIVNQVPTMSYLGSSYSTYLEDYIDYPYNMIYSNFDINAVKAADGSFIEVLHANDDYNPYTGTSTFLLPSNGFADNSKTMVFLNKYTMTIPAGGDKNKLKIDVTGGVAGSGETLMHDFKTVNGKWEGLLKFDRLMYPGDNTITLKVKYDGKTVTSSSVTVKYYDDFIDVDGDGIDDRTGQTKIPDHWELPVNDNTPDGSILGYVRWAFENIGYLIDGVIGLVEGLFKMTGKMSDIMGEYMGFLPKPINTILIVGCMAAIVLKIFGR
jgi:hypothetical protein